MTTEMKAALIGAAVGAGVSLITTIIAAVVSWKIANKTNIIQQQIADSNNKFQKELAKENARSQQRALIDNLILKMSEFRMQYPHLEKTDFCESYPDVTGHPNGKERYEAYCVFIFNIMMLAFKHFEEDAAKLAGYLGVDEIVRTHYKWWNHDVENLGYDEPFHRCIQDVVNRLRREGKIP